VSNCQPAGERQVWRTLHGHKGESRTQPRGTWSHLLQDSGGQGARREAGSAGLAENHRVVIAGRHPQDEPVGPRWGMVEPALGRRRHEGSTSSYHGVCGRHGGEDRCVTQGGLVSSKRQVWPRCCDTRRRKGGQTGNTKGDLKPPGGRCGYKRTRNSSRGGARSRSGAYDSRTRSEHKASDRCREQRRRRAQKVRRRGKAPCFAEQGKRWEAVSRYWEVGEFPG
jgi:hypothetical protein